MGWFTDNPAPAIVPPRPPTLDEQLQQASDAADLAVAAFERAATSLDIAAENFDKIAAESQAQADLHTKRMEAADTAASRNRARANKIRNLLD